MRQSHVGAAGLVEIFKQSDLVSSDSENPLRQFPQTFSCQSILAQVSARARRPPHRSSSARTPPRRSNRTHRRWWPGRSIRSTRAGPGFDAAGPVPGNRTARLLGPVRSGPGHRRPVQTKARSGTGPDRTVSTRLRTLACFSAMLTRLRTLACFSASPGRFSFLFLDLLQRH